MSGHRVRWVTALVAGCVSLLAACTSAKAPVQVRPAVRLTGPPASSLLSTPGHLVDRPVPSSGCGRHPAVRPGTTGLVRVAVPPEAAAGTRQRVFWLHVPPHYDSRRPVPLVLVFHGGGGTGLGMERASRLSVLADRRGFLVAYPQGLAHQHPKGPAGWDASGPADPYAHGTDDGLFTSDVLNAVQAAYCVDPRRIAAAGFSNGGSMVGYLACVLSGRIAAFAAVEGVFFQIAGGCHPARPAAIVDVHVLTDPVAPYAGVPSRGSPDYYALAIPVWLRAWALRDRCRPAPHPVAASSPLLVTQWSGCSGGVSVTGYRLASGGHSWFRALGALAGDRILVDFFAAHPLGQLPPGWLPGRASLVPAVYAPRTAIAALRVFHVPGRSAEPFDIVAGPGGSMWFTEFRADRIGRISALGKITEYRVPTAGAGPYQISAGPGGTIWFTEYNTTKIGRISDAGHIGEIRLPRPSIGGNGIISGPGAAVSLADGAGYLDRFTASGRTSRIRLPAAAGVPFAVTAAAGGPVYISELTGYFEYSRVVFAVRPGHPTATALSIPSRLSNIDALAAGTGRTVWFTDFGTSRIGELLPGGRLRFYQDPAPYAGLSDITRGPDGAMWYTEQAGIVSRITPGGTITQLSLPTPGCNPNGIAAGPRRTIWVTCTGTGTIIRIALRS